jgi:hypothetical protein
MLLNQKDLTVSQRSFLVMKSLILVAMTAAIALSTIVTSQANPRYPQDCTGNYATISAKDCGNGGGGGGGGGGGD